MATDTVSVNARRPGSFFLLPEYVTTKTREFTRFVKLILDSASYLNPAHRALNTAAAAISTVYNSWDFTDIAQSITDFKDGKSKIITASDFVNGICNGIDWLTSNKVINLMGNVARNFSIVGGVTLCFSFGTRAVQLLQKDWNEHGLIAKDKCDLATDIALFAIGVFSTVSAVFAYNFVLAYIACAAVRVVADYVGFLYTPKEEVPQPVNA